MKKMRKLISALLIGAMSLSMMACGGGDSGSTGSTGGTEKADASSKDYSDITLVYASAGAWNMLMPYNATESYSGIVWDQIYDRLFYISGNCELQSRACSSYEISDDGKTYTFHLNEDSVWHDGEPVTAKDWVWTLQLLSSPDITLTTRSIAAELEGTDETGVETGDSSIAATVIDDYTFSITLKQKQDFNGLWMRYNQSFYVLPEHLLADISEADLMADEFWFAPVGSGPCTYESDVSGSEITLASFQDYYLGAPKFGHLVIRVMDQSNFINSLLAGEIDLEWIFLGFEDALTIQDQENVQVVTNEQADFLEIMVYNNRSLSDNRWRQALTMAIDRNALNEGYYEGLGQVYDNWIHMDNEYLPDTAAEDYVYDYDPEAAKALLDESGFDYNYEVKIVCNTASREKQCAIVQQNLEDIGVKSSVQYLDSTTMWSGMYKGEYDICMMGYMPTTDSFSLAKLFDNTVATMGSITDPTYNELFAAVNAAEDETAKAEAIKAAADYLYEQCPNGNVVWKKSMAGLSKRLQNVDVFAANYYNNDTWNWEVVE